MVNVGMGEQKGLDLAGGTGQAGVLIDVPALFHAAVHKKAVPAGFHQGAAAGHFPGSAQKCQLHGADLLWGELIYLRPAPR